MSELAIADLWPLFLVFGVFAGLLVALWRMQGAGEASRDGQQSAQPDEAVPAAGATTGGARRRRGGLARMRAAAAVTERRGPSAGGAGEVDHDGEDGEEGVNEDAGGSSTARVKGQSKKDANREAKRAARAEREEALAAQREKLEKEDEERQLTKEMEEEAEAAAEEKARIAAEEKAKKEAEEYEEWKGLIEVEDAGDEGEDPFVDDVALLERFVTYIKTNKIVVLEELGAEFGLKTEDAIQRLTTLEENGTLSGVFDDRGKFIYVSEDEMAAVAQFISRRGRVSISELAAESTKLLNLDTASASV